MLSPRATCLKIVAHVRPHFDFAMITFHTFETGLTSMWYRCSECLFRNINFAAIVSLSFNRNSLEINYGWQTYQIQRNSEELWSKLSAEFGFNIGSASDLQIRDYPNWLDLAFTIGFVAKCYCVFSFLQLDHYHESMSLLVIFIWVI
jgi:hypothetical protein